MKVQWILYNVLLPNTILVAVVYWAVLYKPGLNSRTSVDWFLDISVHGLNAVLMLIELGMSKFPTRLLHVYQPISYAFIYAFFSIGLWRETGIVLYEYVLDWNRAITAASMTGLLIYTILAQFVLFLIHLGKLGSCKR